MKRKDKMNKEREELRYESSTHGVGFYAAPRDEGPKTACCLRGVDEEMARVRKSVWNEIVQEVKRTLHLVKDFESLRLTTFTRGRKFVAGTGEVTYQPVTPLGNTA